MNKSQLSSGAKLEILCSSLQKNLILIKLMVSTVHFVTYL